MYERNWDQKVISIQYTQGKCLNQLSPKLLSTSRVITWVVHQKRSQKGSFWGGCRPTTWIELDRFTNKVPGIIYRYKRCLIFASSSTVSSRHADHAW